MFHEVVWLTFTLLFFTIKLGSASSLLTLTKQEAVYSVSIRNKDNIHIANGVLLNQVWVLSMINKNDEAAGLTNVSAGSLDWYPDSDRLKPSKILEVIRSNVLNVDTVLLKIEFMKFVSDFIGPAPTMSLGFEYKGNVIDYGWAMGEFPNEDKGHYWKTMFKATGSILPKPECMKHVETIFKNESQEVLGRKYLCTFAVKSPGGLRVGPGAPSIFEEKNQMIGLTAHYVDEIQIHIKLDLFYKWFLKIVKNHAEEWNKNPSNTRKRILNIGC